MRIAERVHESVRLLAFNRVDGWTRSRFRGGLSRARPSGPAYLLVGRQAGRHTMNEEQ
jgi:hypothetical protein